MKIHNICLSKILNIYILGTNIYIPNTRTATTSNIVFPSSNICEKSVSDKDDAVQCNICQVWIHLKCNKLNHINYKYLQGSSDP